MKVCLVIPPIEIVKSFRDRSASYYIGLAYVAGSLIAKNIDCKVIDAKGEGLGIDATVERIGHFDPDIVGFTAMTHEIVRAHKVAVAAKQKYPHLLTVIGGAHARIIPTETMQEFTNFDVICTGEGEIAMVNLARAYENRSDLSDVNGIGYRKGGKIIINPSEPLIEDLDSLSFPAWHLFPRSKGYAILSSRGCPFRCIFCNRISGSKVRYRTTENILAEIEWLITNFNCNIFGFYDETFTINKKKTLELLDTIYEKGLSHKNIRWYCTTRADRIDLELALRMKKTGCYSVSIGVESGNEGVLKRINKNETLKEIKDAVSMLKSVGIRVHTYFIFGHPYETKKEAWDTVKFAGQLNTDGVSFGMMVPYPGTDIYKMAVKNEGGYRLISKDWEAYEKYLGGSLELKNMSKKYIGRLQIIAVLYFYIRNLRIIDFLKYLRKHASTVVFCVRSCCSLKR